MGNMKTCPFCGMVADLNEPCLFAPAPTGETRKRRDRRRPNKGQMMHRCPSGRKGERGLSELPSIFSDRVRTARRAQKCCECHQSIAPGDKYLLSKGCWEGRWDEFKTCLGCDSLRAEMRLDYYDDEMPVFGELIERARERDYAIHSEQEVKDERDTHSQPDLIRS